MNVNAASLVLDSRDDPAGRRSNLLLRYRGARVRCRNVSAVDVLHGRAPEAAVKDAIAIVGATALGTRDGVSHPFDTVFPGVEVQATVADNLLRGDFVSRPPDALTVEIAAVLRPRHRRRAAGRTVRTRWGSAAGLLPLAAAWRGSRG